MNKTEKYQLNQWELTDRIQMEDFNSDNAKIDAALAEQAAVLAGKASHADVSAAQSCVKVADAQLSEDADSLTVTVENAEQYLFYLLCFDTLGSGQVHMTWTGCPETYSFVSTSSGTDVHYTGVSHIIALPNGGLFLQYSIAARTGDAVGIDINRYSTSTLLPEASTSGSINITLTPRPDQKWIAGTYMVIYGFRK